MDVEVKYYVLGRSTAREHAEALAVYYKIERDREAAIVHEPEQGWDACLDGRSVSACCDSKEEAIDSIVKHIEGSLRGW